MHRILANFSGVIIGFYSNSERMLSEIRSKYSAFLLPEKCKLNLTVRIVLSEGEKKAVQNGSEMLISCNSISDNLLWFNDILRMFFLPFFYQKDGIALHASSIIINNTGFVFIGKEGVGKSTKIVSLKKYVSLGDDIALISIQKNQIVLHGSPFYQKTHVNYPNLRINKVVFMFLRQSKYNLVTQELQPLKKLLRNSFCNQKTLISHHFKLISQLSDHTVYYNYQNTLSKNPEQLLLALQQVRYSSIDKVKKRVNKNIVETINFTQCKQGVMFASDTRLFKVIKETSWFFEFDSLRTIEEISTNITSNPNQTNSPHRSLIQNYINSLRKFQTIRWPIIVKKNAGSSEVVDGNHHLIAAYCIFIQDNIDLGIPILFV